VLIKENAIVAFVRPKDVPGPVQKGAQLSQGTSTTIEIVGALEPLADEWAELADDVGATPFLYPGWFQAWWSAFGAGALRLVTARRDDRLVGVVPMQARRGAWRSPTNAHSPGFDLLALDAKSLTVLSEALLAESVRELHVGPLDATGTALRALGEAARSRGYRTFVRPAGRAPYLRLAGDLRTHESSLSRNLRHDVERRLRRLCEAGVVSVQVSDGSACIDDLLEEGLRVEALGWKGRHGTAIAARAETTRFYTRLARWAAAVGWLRLAFLRLDGRAIAFQFDLELRSGYYSLKIGYDPEFERFSPGKLLAYMMVSRAVGSGLEVYELLGREEPWKARWTELARDQVVFRAFSPSLAGRLASSTFAYGRPLVRKVPFASRVAAGLRR
jgi:CelD/BcsL family acetyltransferase involved in cellulose biosynthesis